MDLANVWAEYVSIPPITRVYTTACLLLTILVQLDIVTPFHLYFNPTLVFRNMQLWRLITTFCFFGPVGFSFLFNMLFTYRYCRYLEEGSFHGRPADFLLMFIFGATAMTIAALFVHMAFLGHALTMMLVYVWSRRNPHVRITFFGVLNFNAPYLPYVLLAFSLLLSSSVLVDFMGIAFGHFYFVLEDVFPRQKHGFRVLKTPAFLEWLFESANAQAIPDLHEEHHDQIGGFDLRDAPRPDAEASSDDAYSDMSDADETDGRRR